MSWQYQTDGPVTSSPRFYRGAVYVGSGDGCVYSIDAETGKARWKFKTDGPVPASPAISDGILYIGSTDRHVYALRA
jgi:outer membrane protein assembly factor BamB